MIIAQVSYMSGLRPGQKIFIRSVKYNETNNEIYTEFYFMGNTVYKMLIVVYNTGASVYYKNIIRVFHGNTEACITRTHKSYEFDHEPETDKFVYLVRPRYHLMPKKMVPGLSQMKSFADISVIF